MSEAFASFLIFSTKYTGIFEILTFEILTKRYLTMSIVSNKRALKFADNKNAITSRSSGKPQV